MVTDLREGARLSRFLTRRYLTALLLIAALLVAKAAYVQYGTGQRNLLRDLERTSDNEPFLLASLDDRLVRMMRLPAGERGPLAAEIGRIADDIAVRHAKVVTGARTYDREWLSPSMPLSPVYDRPDGLDVRIRQVIDAARRIAASPATIEPDDPDIAQLEIVNLQPTIEMLEYANDRHFAAIGSTVQRMSTVEIISNALVLLLLVGEAWFLFRPMVKDVVAAHRRLEEYNRLKSEFIASISHEIRTPMNGIFGVAELLQESNLDDRQQQHLRALLNAADGLLVLIDDILDLSRLDAGTVSIDPLSFDLRLAIEDVAQMMAAQAVTKPLEVIVRYQPGLPTQVVGDPGRVRQILCNLVGNALKFTAQGYVAILVERDEGEDVPFRIVVEDTGIGIAPERLGAIFETFGRVDGSDSRKEGGLGIGLPIARRLTELMGGRIDVSSEPGAGSRFTLSIPFGVANAPVVSQAGKAALEKARLLIVDDLPLNRQLFTEQLSPIVADCWSAGSAQEAIRLMREAVRQGRPFDLVLHDFLMPGMDGEEMARIVKADPSLRQAVLVMVTSAGETGYAQRFAGCGIAAYLAKPVRTSLLLDTLSLALERRWEKDASLITIHTTQALAAARLRLRPHLLEGSRILLVEDNRVNLQFTAELLTQMGCDVSCAENGIVAIEQVTVRAFDLVLMDCQMPEMDGFEATRRIRHLVSRGEIMDMPIVALTANAMTGDRERCLKAGMNDYLTKPVRRASLEAMLSNWIAPRDIDEWTATARRTGRVSAARGMPEPAPVDYPTAFDPREREPMNETISPIDTGMLEETRELMEDKFATLLAYYIEDSRSYLNDMREGAAAGDASRVSAAAHTLKSSSRQFGLLRLGELAAVIEESARHVQNAGVALPDLEERIDAAGHAFIEAEKVLASYLEPDERWSAAG